MIATAKIQLTIEIEAGSNWEKGCSADQIYGAAGREAVQRLEQIFLECEKNRRGSTNRAHVIGKPRVTVILLTEKEDK